MGRVPTYGNQFQGLRCALLSSRGTKAVTGVAPFVLIEHTLVILDGTCMEYVYSVCSCFVVSCCCFCIIMYTSCFILYL